MRRQGKSVCTLHGTRHLCVCSHSFPCLSFLFFPFPSLLSSSLSFVFFVVNITIGFIKGSGQLQQEIWSETSSRCARPREWALLLGTLLAEACSKQTKRYKRTNNQVRGERKGDERREINWRIRWGCLSYFFFFFLLHYKVRQCAKMSTEMGTKRPGPS